MHKVAWHELSDEQRSTVHELSDRLGLQCPDHVTNVVRLWEEVKGMRDSEGLGDEVVRDLGRVWRLEEEGEVVLEALMEKVEMEVGETSKGARSTSGSDHGKVPVEIADGAK